jgi:hypothetical protein
MSIIVIVILIHHRHKLMDRSTLSDTGALVGHFVPHLSVSLDNCRNRLFLAEINANWNDYHSNY